MAAATRTETRHLIDMPNRIALLEADMDANDSAMRDNTEMLRRILWAVVTLIFTVAGAAITFAITGH